MSLKERNFEIIKTNGVNLRCVVEGNGPLIILMHGWPQCWYLWRHQIDPLVAQGWTVCVPDQRGYGMSDCPAAVGDYKILDLCADIDGLASALGHETYVLGIHDWGAIVGWNVAQLYPERVRAVIGMSVPYTRGFDPAWCTQAFWGDTFFYWAYFCDKIVAAETEFESDIRNSLLAIHMSASGNAGESVNPIGKKRMLDALPAPAKELPSWMTEEDLDYYVELYSRSGFRGGLNWYRNIPTLMADTKNLEGIKIKQPSIFLTGEVDPVRIMAPHEAQAKFFDDLREQHVIENVGHWLQLEAKDEVNEIILNFLAEFV